MKRFCLFGSLYVWLKKKKERYKFGEGVESGLIYNLTSHISLTSVIQPCEDKNEGYVLIKSELRMDWFSWRDPN